MMICPVVIFANDSPERLEQVLAALRPQGIERLVVLADIPHDGFAERVKYYNEIENGIDWAKTEFSLTANRERRDVTRDITSILANYDSAIFVEDSCLPMPGFYSFMTETLRHYRGNKKVFSISGYQPVKYKRLKNYFASLASCARFMPLGWATWRDQWQFVLPYLSKSSELYRHAEDVPDIARHDLSEMKSDAALKSNASWSREVTLTTIWLGKSHLLPRRGLVRRIAFDADDLHKDSLRIHNSNVYSGLSSEITWLEDVEASGDYTAHLKKFFVKVMRPRHPRLKDRGLEHVRSAYRLGRRTLGTAKRSIFRPPHRPPPLKYFDVNLLESSSSDLTKRALLSYVTDRFTVQRQNPEFLHHILTWHCKEIVRVLNRMGYQVDVVSYDDRTFLPERSYDLFIGHMGINFQKIARALSVGVPKIYLSTTNYWDFHNKQELARFAALKGRQGVDLPLLYDRFLHYPEEEALESADGIVGFGNVFTRKTYADFSPVFVINNTALADNHFETSTKNYDHGRNHFLFFSGPGSVHKGLDLLLEAFSQLRDQHLWICTQIEAPFEAVYDRLLHQQPNIHFLGWIQPRSQKYYDLISSCNFTILPSCSEGGVQSVVEGMNQGLIPVISRECAVDVNDFGVYLDPPAIDSIVQMVKRVSAYSPEQCKKMSSGARRESVTHYSEAKFSANFQNALEAILRSKQGGAAPAISE